MVDVNEVEISVVVVVVVVARLEMLVTTWVVVTVAGRVTGGRVTLREDDISEEFGSTSLNELGDSRRTSNGCSRSNSRGSRRRLDQSRRSNSGKGGFRYDDGTLRPSTRDIRATLGFYREFLVSIT